MKKQRIDPKLGKIFDQIIDQFEGLPTSTNTKLEEWIYNWIGERGHNQSAYADKIKLPAYPLTTKVMLEYGLPEDLLTRTHRGNKYLGYQFERMKKAKEQGNSKLYWAIFQGLLKRSTYFKLVFLNKACPGWYYNKDWGYIIKQIKDMKKLWKEDRIEIKRFYVKKPNGKLRPIGAPSKRWIAHLSQWAWGLGYWVEGQIDRRQHGFVSKKGIWSAWTEFLTRVRGKASIVEYDMSKYFNTIRLRAQEMWQVTTEFLGTEYFWNSQPIRNSLESALKNKGIPKEVVEKLLRHNEMSKPEFKGTEWDHRDPELWTKDLAIADFKRTPRGKKVRVIEEMKYEDSDGIIRIPQEVAKASGDAAIASEVMEEAEYTSINQQVYNLDPQTIYLDVKKGKSNNWDTNYEEYIGENPIPEYYGLTQGSPTSPVLANIFLDEWKLLTDPRLVKCPEPKCIFDPLMEPDQYYETEGWDGIQYADDGILCSDRVGANKLMRHLHQKEKQVLGTKINWEKTKVVKDRGEWKTKFKFLGSEYDPWKNTLNEIPVEKIDYKKIYEIVGKTYSTQNLKDWGWEIKPTSWLGILDSRKKVGRPSKEGLVRTTEQLTKDPRNHPYTKEMSTVINSMVLAYLRRTKQERAIKRTRGRPIIALERKKAMTKWRNLRLVVKKGAAQQTT